MSRKAPGRGGRLSAATTRYVGCFFLPMRTKRSFTATTKFPSNLLSRSTGTGRDTRASKLALFWGCNPPAFLLLVFATTASNRLGGLHSRAQRLESGGQRVSALGLRRHVRHTSHAARHGRHRARAHLAHHLSHLIELLQELI